MKVMLGIPAYEEESNIDNLLTFLINNCLNDVDCIYVVSSGSKDRTNEIVESYAKKFSKIHLIVEEERKGKASALNKLLTLLDNNYEVMVYLGADNLPEKGSMNKLIKCLSEEGVSVVGGKPVPVNGADGLAGFFAHVLWNLHHLISLETPKISGEMMAFKKGILREAPPTLINDDLYIQAICEMNNHDMKYCPEATVFLKGPETISDFLRQRRRIFVGHKQIKSMLGKRAPTMRWQNMNLLLRACPYTGVKGSIYAIMFVFFQGLAYSLSLFDFFLGRLPYKWDMVKTSKKIT